MDPGESDMTPTHPAPRVTTDRVARYIDAHRITDSGDSLACRIALDLLDARQQIAELEATIANEQGRGEPPSPGWEFDGDIRWTRPFGPRVTGGVVGEWLIEDAIGPGEAWVVIGRASTAREGMRAADAARVAP